MKVTYRHYRFPKFPSTHLYYEVTIVERRHGSAFRYYRNVSRWKPTETGGYTQCVLELPDGTQFEGWSDCSKRDGFCYKLGREIAFGRAFKLLASSTSWPWDKESDEIRMAVRG